jgi:Domain of unknown function (DUF4389)
VRLSLRLSAYQNLLNDRFPSFALEDRAEDMVRLAVPEATRMNRWAVFFRIILIIPVGVLSAIVQYGSILFVVFGWFAALITGWLPTPIYDLNRSVVRFQTRVSAFTLLLVPTYPSKLFGDPEPLAAVLTRTPLDPDAPLVPPAPPAPPVWAPPTSLEPPVESAAVPGLYLPAPNEIQQPRMHPSWSLVLGRGGRRLLIIAIIIGVPAYAASIAGDINRSVAAINDTQLIQANNTLVNQISQFGTQGRACQGTADATSCFESNDGRLARQLTTFAHTLSNSSDSNISQRVISNAESSATRLARLFRAVSEAGPNEAAFKRANNVTAINNAATNVLSSLDSLRTALDNS